jgi:hypothetical protein
MTPIFLVLLLWICIAIVNVFLVQFLLQRMRGEAPHYLNAFFATAISGVAAQLAGFALFSSFGAPASLLGSLILGVFLYSKLLRLPSGGEVSYGQSLVIVFAQFILIISTLLSFLYVFLERGASSQSGGVASRDVARAFDPWAGFESINAFDSFLRDYGSYLAFMLVFIVIFLSFNPYRKSRQSARTLPVHAKKSEKEFVESSQLKGSTEMDGEPTDKDPDPSKASANHLKTRENTRTSVAPGMLQGPSGAIRISGIAIILSCLFPPWCIQAQVRTTHVGYRFFLNPPEPGTTVNTSLLLVQICAIFLCGAAFWLAGRK